MRKFYTLITIVAATFAAQAQTPLNVNGSLEDWADATTQPTGWFINQGLLTSGDVAKVTGGAQDGDNFVKIVAPTSSYNAAGLQDIPVEGGETYTISYYYKELNDGNARLRHWGQWREDASTNIDVSNDPFQPSEFIMDTDGEWTLVTVTSTAPANATLLRFNFRVYPQNSNGGGEFGFDNVIVYQGLASVKENNIEGLNIYPNPATNIVNVTSANPFAEKHVQLFDMVGKKVIDVKTTSTINIESLNKGIYVIKINEEGKTATRKLVVK